MMKNTETIVMRMTGIVLHLLGEVPYNGTWFGDKSNDRTLYSFRGELHDAWAGVKEHIEQLQKELYDEKNRTSKQGAFSAYDCVHNFRLVKELEDENKKLKKELDDASSYKDKAIKKAYDIIKNNVDLDYLNKELENENARLQAENAALRERVDLLESKPKNTDQEEIERLRNAVRKMSDIILRRV